MSGHVYVCCSIVFHLFHGFFSWIVELFWRCSIFCFTFYSIFLMLLFLTRGRRGRDRMVVGFTTTYTINSYHHWSCEFESRSWRGVLDTTLCDTVCQWFAAGRWFSPGIPVSFTNIADRHDKLKSAWKWR